MHHRVLARQRSLQTAVFRDFGFDRVDARDIDRHAVKDRDIAAPTQVFSDVSTEPAGTAGHDNFLIAHISSRLAPTGCRSSRAECRGANDPVNFYPT
jgi:hypothetical protein